MDGLENAVLSKICDISNLCSLRAMSWGWPSPRTFPPPRPSCPAASLDAQPTAEALKAVLAQQKTLTDNQGKIDDKLAVIAENLRIARIYGSRIK